jgi:hypothetical protein
MSQSNVQCNRTVRRNQWRTPQSNHASTQLFNVCESYHCAQHPTQPRAPSRHPHPDSRQDLPGSHHPSASPRPNIGPADASVLTAITRAAAGTASSAPRQRLQWAPDAWRSAGPTVRVKPPAHHPAHIPAAASGQQPLSTPPDPPSGTHRHGSHPRPKPASGTSTPPHRQTPKRAPQTPPARERSEQANDLQTHHPQHLASNLRQTPTARERSEQANRREPRRGTERMRRAATEFVEGAVDIRG